MARAPCERPPRRRDIRTAARALLLVLLAPPGLLGAQPAPDHPLPLTPIIGLEPGRLDFASCLSPGECQQLTFELFNAADDSLSVLEVTTVQLAATQFTLIDGPAPPLSLPGDGTRVTYTVLFCPNGYPAVGVVLVLATNAPNSPAHVMLSGDGNLPPVCAAGGPYVGVPGAPITFDGSGSFDPDPGPGIVAYAWDFGDGTSGTGIRPQHAYAATGTYTVSLRVEDGCREAHRCTTRASIGEGNAPPVCDAGGPYAGLLGEPIRFDGTGSFDPDGVIVAYVWNFGDGQGAGGPTPTHTYAEPGSYTVLLRVTDNRGAASSCQTVATVSAVNAPPVCAAGGPYLARAGVGIPFDGSRSVDPDGTIVSYAWQFGDGATGSGPRPVHAYADPGTYDVELCVTDDRGLESCCQTTATILPGDTPLTPVIGVVPAELDFGRCTPVGTGSELLTVTVANAVFDPESILLLTGVEVTGPGFSLAGGPPPPVSIPGDGSSVDYTLGFTPSGIEPAIGELTLVAPEATNSPLAVPLRGAGNTPPVCDAGGPYSGLTGVPIQFDGTGSGDPGGTTITYVWDFGDGGFAFVPRPQHTYAAHGTYTVTLTLTDDCEAMTSCSTTATLQAPPVCNAGGPYYSLPGYPVQFDGSASHDPDGTIVLYAWDFGDGSSGSGPTPTHVYTEVGTFEVTLAVTDNDGYTRSCITFVDTGAVPVAGVDSVAAVVRGTSVELRWVARGTERLLGFEVRRGRAEPPGPLAPIAGGLVRDADGYGRFACVDRDLEPGQRYRYEIVAVGRGGERETLASILVAVPALALNVHRPEPHPTAFPATIAIDLPRAGAVRVRIVDAGGRIVRDLLASELGAGRHRLAWDGRDAGGRLVPAGVYFVLLESAGERRWMKLVAVR